MTAEIRCLESAPFAQNSYVLCLPGRTDAVAVDPGFEPDLILELLKEEGLTLAAILNTHGHVDHIAGSFDQLAKGIHAKLFPLPGDSVVYPGHGPVTTVGYEKANNPFVGERASREH